MPPVRTGRAPTEIDESVGGIIRRARMDANLTLAELAAELGISHQQLQKYETGTNRISAGMLWQIAGVLKMPIEAFFPGGSADDDLPGRLRRAERKLGRIREIVGGAG